MRIVVLDGWMVNPGDIDWKPLEALGSLEVYDHTPPEKLAERLAGANAALTLRVYLGKKELALAGAQSLQFIGLFATGTNMVDLDAAHARGIAVANVPGYSTQAVAQHTIALLLEICNQVAAFNADVQAGGWQRSLGLAHPMRELCGKTFGAIGFGAIGRATGQIAKAMGMRVLATGSRPVAEGQAIAEYVDLNTLLEQADVVSLHCPLKQDTAGIINRHTLARCRPGAILLNTGRGGLVEEQALADALQSGRLYAAGVDVTAAEPIAADSPLLGAPRCIITPHAAWTARETRARLLGELALNLAAFKKGRPRNLV